MQKSDQTALPRSVVNQAWLIVLGAIAPMLDSTMVNIAINHLAHDFNTGLNTVQWVVTGYLLAMVVAVPFTGWLDQRFGGKNTFLVAELLFGLMSLGAAFAWNIDSLIAFRLVQGFSAGLITPLLTTLLVDVAGSGAMGRLMAVVGLPIMLGPIVGPVIGGVIVQYLTWRWIFLVNVPVTIIAAWLLWTKLPATPAKNPQAKFDWIGVLLLAGMSASVIYGVVQASQKANFTNHTTLTDVAIGLVLLVGYLVYAAFKRTNVLIPLTLFKRLNFSAAMVGLFLAGVATNGPMLLLPLFFQNLRGESVAIAGLSLLPQGIGMLLARPVVGRLIDQIGARWVTLGGLAITLIGSLPFIYFNQHSAYWLLMLVLFVRGIGAGAILSPLMTDAFVGADKQFSAQVSIATRIMQNVGGAFGSAFLATIVVGYQNQHAHTLTQIATSYQQGFLWAVIFTAILALPALFLTNRLKAH
ncbi:DHA2 family efflux MFS transporter permease subunit [Loigolactobacillus bifermentans]|uniref:Drug resistance transporter EmrB QacA subfamily protein n=1 Tax=Loigolactobacillus bifermentans DSM 20003 TaxID=1423726 RepID=A0A0R1GZ53_9LACO|nr:DHA2 family efflux MFS transporter permease subunit [Loigolactobacillus bifermentans]KRK39455.1 drug resistance transporter EmrB QacA subfamily protein [Loigolactobacillus bifermentans DSM 20003]QGG61221.1 DHA2 family efflux MFS transporter permease subunit [Loigolactobacillus bifermentans]